MIVYSNRLAPQPQNYLQHAKNYLLKTWGGHRTKHMETV